MSIRYDKDFNREIRRIVKNFNEKRNRAERAGFKLLPRKVLVSELKKRYESRTLLKKELSLLASFNNQGRSALEVIETEGGVKAIKWELDYLKETVSEAKKHYDRLILDASKDDVIYNIGKKAYLEQLQRERYFLDFELNYLNQPDFRTYKRIIDKFQNYSAKMGASYRGFLSEVEYVMEATGIPEKRINQFMNKFTVLTPRQFDKLYHESDLVKRIYDIADSPENQAEMKLNTTIDDAKDRVEALLNSTDQIVEKYRSV